MTGNRFHAAVVGGGLVGLAAAVAVARAGLRTLHIAPKAPPDRRTSALMQPAVDYLRTAGLLHEPSSIGQPLTAIRIIDATRRLVRAPETLFDAREFGLEAFGWNLPNVRLAELFERARTTLPNLETRETTLQSFEPGDSGTELLLGNGEMVTAGLVVGADGKGSRVRESGGFRAREHGFTQAALVCDLGLERPIGGTSVEFHFEQGPFTLVPAGGNRANLVWIDDRVVLREAQAGGAEHLAPLFRDKAHRLFGKIEVLTPAHVFLLSTLSVDVAGHDGVVLVGEAAHAFPPIGAQGLNLGLRDVADLAAALSDVDLTAPDAGKAISADYATRRTSDLLRTGVVVDTLFRSLLSDFLPAQAARAAGLWALKLTPPLRQTAIRVGMGVR